MRTSRTELSLSGDRGAIRHRQRHQTCVHRSSQQSMANASNPVQSRNSIPRRELAILLVALSRRVFIEWTTATLFASPVLQSIAAETESGIASLIPDGIDFGVVQDATLAYEFLYPRQYLSGAALPMSFYRKPVRYTLAAQQSVEGLQRIVCGLGAFEQGVVVTVAVGPPPDSAEMDLSSWSATKAASVVLADMSVSRQSGRQRIPIAAIENAMTETRSGRIYWTYESILTGSPTARNQSKETYRHSLNVTSVRNGAQGTPFLYTLSLSCPQDQWDDLQPLFDLSASSFRLTEESSRYVAPDEAQFLIF